MKRLSDERVQEIQENEGAGCIDNPDYQGGEDPDSLFCDHLQAREDRKRLAAALQTRVNDCCTSTNRCMWCVRDLALLAEVDPQ